MNVCHILAFFLFILTTLQDGEACFHEENIVYNRTGTEGGDITFVCGFDSPSQRMIFCRDGCKDQDILIKAAGVMTQRGRYRMEYDEEELQQSVTDLHVSISNLTKADSGRYSCVFGGGRYAHENQTFQLRVVDAPKASRSAVSPPPVSSSGLGTPAAAKGLPPESNRRVQPQVQLLLLFMIIVSAAALLTFCRRRTGRQVFTSPEDPQVELEDANITGVNREHEEVGGKILEI